MNPTNSSENNSESLIFITIVILYKYKNNIYIYFSVRGYEER